MGLMLGKFVFELFDVDRDVWDDYYQRIIFLNNTIADLDNKEEERKQEREKPKSNKTRSVVPKR